MTAVECVAALAGAVLGWKAGGLLNELHSLKRPTASTAARLAFPAAARIHQAPASQRAAAGEAEAVHLERLSSGGVGATAGASASGEKSNPTKAR